MTTPFTYCVTHIPSGKKYYGVRYKKNCRPQDLWEKYFTSSKIIKQLIESEGISSFYVEIRKVFTCKQKAIEWEHKVLRRLKVCQNEKWLNKSYGKAPSTAGFVYSEASRIKMSEWQKGNKNPMYGKPHSDETKNKISSTLKGRKRSEDTKRKISKSKKGKPFTGYNSQTPETIEKRRVSCTGKKRSEEQKQKMSEAAKGRKWKLCPLSGKRIFYREQE
jgi:group I intron endonuclease